MTFKDEKVAECKSALDDAVKGAERASVEFKLAHAECRAGGSSYRFDRTLEESNYASRQLKIARARHEAALKL
jgi:hypothetical protein